MRSFLNEQCNEVEENNRMGKNIDLFKKFKREGTYVYLWLIHADIWQKTTKFCKAIILQLKNKFFKNKKKYYFMFTHMFTISKHLLLWKEQISI